MTPAPDGSAGACERMSAPGSNPERRRSLVHAEVDHRCLAAEHVCGAALEHPSAGAIYMETDRFVEAEADSGSRQLHRCDQARKAAEFGEVGLNEGLWEQTQAAHEAKVGQLLVCSHDHRDYAIVGPRATAASTNGAVISVNVSAMSP